MKGRYKTMAYRRDNERPNTRKDSRDGQNNRGKGKPKSKKPYEKKSAAETVETSAIGGNDPDWYIPDPKVMEMATGISFDDFVGVAVDFDPLDSLALNKSVLNPGALMQVFINPSPGYTGLSKPKLAAINQQGFRTYARLSSINAKNTNYLPNDVTTLILAMGELISMVAVAQRAYGLLWTYNIRNRTLPSLLVDCSGIKASVLRKTAAPYLTRLNTLLVEANKIPFPSNIDYFKRCQEVFSTVYRDSDSDMSEIYVPIPFSTWNLEEDQIIEGTCLRTKVLYQTGNNFSPEDPTTFLDMIEEKINVLMTSATYNYVYSDIINLATKDPSVQLLHFAPVETSYTVMPVLDTEWLLKINNATILGEPIDTDEMHLAEEHTPINDVLPDVNSLSLTYAPQFYSFEPSLGLEKLINFTHDNPDMKERLMSTRYYNSAPLVRMGETPVGDETPWGYYTTDKGVAMADHYIVGINVFTDTTETADLILSTSGLIDAASPKRISILTRFSFHPYIYEFEMETPSMQQSLEGMLGDLDFFTNMEFATINKVNHLAMFALFDVKDATKGH